ncbi:MAG: alpha/beta hydrolase [Methanospirillum sp.]|nr:alpha/beta hydrolase [Methanospirillum sp.]
MGSAQNFSDLAKALSETFTVYVPDRRGRGMSPCLYRKDHTIQRDVEDLEAILSKTNAHFVFGLSSGAIISLQASTILPSIHKVAAYEPPFFVDGLPIALLERYEKEVTRGRIAAALTAAGKAVEVRPIPWFMPDWLLTFFMNRILVSQDKQPAGEYLPLRELTVTLQYDFRIVTEMHGTLEHWRDVRADVLLLGGGRSPAYLKTDLDAVEKVLPSVRRVTFPDLDHSASWNYDPEQNPTGKPELVAKELRKFFA